MILFSICVSVRSCLVIPGEAAITSVAQWPFYVQTLTETSDNYRIVLVYRYHITWVSGQLESVKLF